MLDDEQRASYRRDGYLVLPGFRNGDEIAPLRARTALRFSRAMYDGG